MDYKIIKNNKVIEVVHNPRFVRFLSSGHKALTDQSSAHGIIGTDNQTIYSFADKVVEVKEISAEEFNRLSSLLNSGKEVCADESLLAKARRNTLNALSRSCKAAIAAGFSITMSSGHEYKFSLTAEDQLNLLNLENQLNSGADTFIYHADGMPCRIFDREEILQILSAYRKHVLFHTTYFNIAKQYINSITDIGDINSFTYGMDVSNMTNDLLLKQIIKTGGC